MKKRDLRWMLAYPVYQLIGTARHEAGHALVAWLEGYPVKKFVFWPAEGRWGYVVWGGPVTAFGLFGPYALDLLTFLAALVVVRIAHLKRHWLWLNVVILGMISPFVNSLYNYWGGLRGSSNDVGQLLVRWPVTFVHGYFWATLVLYLGGIVWALRCSQRGT